MTYSFSSVDLWWCSSVSWASMVASSLMSSPHHCMDLHLVSACRSGWSPVSGCGMTVYSGTVRMVRGARVPSAGGVVVMGTVGVTTLHP
jgi:hypothetical protein